MTKFLQSRATRWLAVAGLAVLLLGAARAIEAAPLVQGQGRVAVVVYPDVAGKGDDPACPGCDQAFTDDDTEANADDPLPSLNVVLRGADDKEVDRSSTTGLANGRQVAFFTVPAPAAFTVELVDVPAPWVACSNSAVSRELAAADFDDATGIATVEIYLWRACAEPAAGTDEPESTPDTEATESTPDTEATESTPESGAATVEPSETPATDATTAATAATAGTAVSTTVPAAPSGAIRGLVFTDLDGDGKLTADEPGVSGVTVRLTGGGLTETQATAGAGTFAFPGLASGRYDVAVDVPAGYRITTTDRYIGVEITDATVMGYDFGLAVVATSVAPAAEPTAGPDGMPGTGVSMQSRGGLLMGLAAVVGALGVLGLALEFRLDRRSLHSRKGQQ